MSTFPLSISSVRVFLALDQSLLGLDSFDDLEWTEVTQDVRGVEGIKLVRGKTDERQDLRTSTARFVLDNNNGDWDKDNPDSPHYGKLLPFTPFKIETDEAEERPVMLGVTGDSWPVPHVAEDDSWIVLDCTDAFVLLARCPLQMYAPAESSWNRILRILRYASWPEGEWIRYGDEGGSVIAATHFSGQSAMEALMLVLRTECIYRTFLGIDKGGRMAFAGRYAPFQEPFNVVQAEFGEDGIPVLEAVAGSEGKNLYTQVEVTADLDAAQSVSVNVGTDAPAGAEVVILDTLFSGEDPLPIEVPEGAVWDFGTGLVARQPTATPVGSPTLPIEPITRLIPASSTATWATNLGRAGNNDAQIRYGKTKLTYSNLLLQSRAEAQAMAEDALLEYSEPRSRIELIRISGIYEYDCAEALIDLAVGERIIYRHRQRYMTEAVEWELLIHGIELDLFPGFSEGRLRTSLAPVPRNFWIWGQAAWGASTYWSY